jgi:carboxypeptidase T
MKKLFFLLAALTIISTMVFAAGSRSFIEVKTTNLKDIGHFKSLNLDIAGVNRKENLVGIVATQSEIELLKNEGYEVFVRVASSRPEDASLDQYYTPEEMLDIINQTAASYPGIAKLMKISDGLWEGNDVYAVKITKNVDEDNTRPTFFLDAQHHAREVMTSQIAVDMIQYLTSKYGTDPEVTNWVDNINIIVVPMVNPDGISYVFSHDRWQRRNRNPVCQVDLNRNYDWNWDACGGSSGWCQDDTYRGATPGSEPETTAMETLMAENPAIYALTYHSYGEYILFPLGCYDPSDVEAYWEFGNELNSVLKNDQGFTGQYLTGPGWSTIYTTDGTSDDTHYGKYGAMAICIEVNGTGFQPDYGQYRDITVERQRTAWQFLLNKTLNSPMVQGFVTDSATGAPIQAQVDVEEIPLIHNETLRHASSKGFYARVTPKNSTYHVTFSKTGYCSETKEIAVGEGIADLNVSLAPSGDTPPSNPLPADGSVNQQVSASLSWTGSAGNYSLYFGDNQNPPFLTTTTSTSYTLANLEYGKTYYWRVDTQGGCGSSTGVLWSFSTYKFGITSVAALKNPLRLAVMGIGFTGDSTIKINGVEVPSVMHKSSTKLVGKGGAALKSMLPKGTEVSITVEDPSGASSLPFKFTR